MSDEFGFGALALQSGFVVAVLIAAIFLAERLGGDEVLALRGIQVAIGIALTLVVLAGTTAFIRPPETPDASFFDSISGTDSEREQEELQSFVQESARRGSEAGSVQVGLGVVFALLGGILLHRMKAIPPGFLLGGLLLLLLGAGAGGQDSVNLLTSFYGASLGGGDAGQARDTVQFGVLLIGTLVLLGLTWWRWETKEPQGEAPRESTGRDTSPV
jgi:hypothetical protein